MTQEFDFIIIGGGTSGCLIAEGLATSPSKPKIALFEAGDKHEGTELRRAYDRFSLIFTNPELDHGYLSTPQEQLHGRQIPQLRGNVLGGTSHVNFQIWSVGAKDEFNYWADEVHGPEWGFDSVLETIKKIENVSAQFHSDWDKYIKIKPDIHGFDGPVEVSIGPNIEPEAKYILEAGVESGHRLNLDQNNGDPIGFGITPNTSKNGLRTTSASAFIYGNKLPNLEIFTGSSVSKIVFEANKAVGVEYNGVLVLAKKEVILTAGAVDSPKILLLSGVGPKLELGVLGIDITHDLPGVGKSLTDHPCVPMTYHMGHNFSGRVNFSSNPDNFLSALKELDASGTGPLTRHNSTTPTAYLKSPDIHTSAEFKGLSQKSQELLQKSTVPHFEFATNGPLIPPTYEFEDPEDSYFNFFVTLMNSQSKGDISLASANPADRPLIDPKYLTNPYDKLALVSAIREALKWMESPSLKQHVKYPILAPKSASDEDITGFIQAAGMGLYHTSGTVKMGLPSNRSSCVDRDLKVHGLESLRVADMSVTPMLPSGHPQVLSYAIGNIAVGKIKAEWNL